jgi:hypothetical protein
MDQQFLAGLSAATSYAIDGSQLRLTLKDGGTLEFAGTQRARAGGRTQPTLPRIAAVPRGLPRQDDVDQPSAAGVDDPRGLAVPERRQHLVA